MMVVYKQAPNYLFSCTLQELQTFVKFGMDPEKQRSPAHHIARHYGYCSENCILGGYLSWDSQFCEPPWLQACAGKGATDSLKQTLQPVLVLRWAFPGFSSGCSDSYDLRRYAATGLLVTFHHFHRHKTNKPPAEQHLLRWCPVRRCCASNPISCVTSNACVAAVPLTWFHRK